MKNRKPEIYVGRPMIFTNGAFVSPGKVIVNGREAWCWIVESFEGYSFYDGEEILPIENSYNKENLLKLIEDAEE